VEVHQNKENSVFHIVSLIFSQIDN